MRTKLVVRSYFVAAGSPWVEIDLDEGFSDFDDAMAFSRESVVANGAIRVEIVRFPRSFILPDKPRYAPLRKGALSLPS